MDARFLNESKILESRWSQLGFLEGIKGFSPTATSHERACAAVILENQKLYNELATDSSDVANFKRISIPLVRRIFPQLIANKVVSVQPLLGPTGLVYYLRFRTSSNKGATQGATTNSGFPGDDPYSLQQDAAGNAQLDVYYSSQFVNGEVGSTSIGGAGLVYQYSPVQHTPILAGTVTGTVYDGSTAIQYFSVSQGGVFSFTDIGSPSPKAQTSGSTINVTTGEVQLTWTGDPGDNHFVINYEYNMECNQDLPEINMVVEDESITAKTRKLKAVWSFEAQQDLRSQHNLDAEQELTAVLAQEINLEIDREILGDLRLNAGTVASWDYNTALGDTVKERYESLYVKLVEISNVVHRKTLRGGCNWIVTSPEVASMFETATAGFAPTASETFTSSLGIQYVGTVNNRWRIYKDPLYPSNQILLGFKGDSYMDSGYFFCPYVPLTQTPTVLDPESFCPRKGLMTRYGKKLLREGAKFYARLSIANFAV